MPLYGCFSLKTLPELRLEWERVFGNAQIIHGDLTHKASIFLVYKPALDKRFNN